MIEKYALFRLLKALRDEGSLSELAKRGSVGIGVTKTYLDELLKKGIVKRKIIGRSHIYSYNTENFFSRACRNYLSLWEISESGLVQELASKYSGLVSVVLYGSVARGEDSEKSDIDILIILRKRTKITSLKAEKALGRELTILTYTLPEWRRKAMADKVFYDNIIIDGIALYGGLPVVR